MNVTILANDNIYTIFLCVCELIFIHGNQINILQNVMMIGVCLFAFAQQEIVPFGTCHPRNGASLIVQQSQKHNWHVSSLVLVEQERLVLRPQLLGFCTVKKKVLSCNHRVSFH